MVGDSLTKETDLIPPDYDHCQCEITPAHGPFVLGPRPRPQQCNETPVWLAVEIVAGKDGKHGSMTLCNSCAKEMMENKDLRRRVQLQPIFNKGTTVQRHAKR